MCTVPGVAEHVRDLLLDQVLDDEVTSAHLGHRISPLDWIAGRLRGNYTTLRKTSTVSRTPTSSGVSGESNHGSGSSSGNGSGTSSKVISAPGTAASISATSSGIAVAGAPRLNVCAPAGSDRAACTNARATSGA